MLKNKRKIIFVLLFVILILVISFCVYKLNNNKTQKELINNNLKLEKDESIGENIYVVNNVDNLDNLDVTYQQDVDNLIYNKKLKERYNEKNPLFVFNPYNTNITGLYVYFDTTFKYKIEYIISVDDETIPDYTNTFATGYSNKHEAQIIGLIQGMENTLKIRLIDNNNKLKKEYEFKIFLPEYNTNSIKKIESKMLVPSDEIEDGLYMFSNISNSDVYQDSPLVFYDKYGVLRAEFTAKSGNHTNRVTFVDGKFFYAIDSSNYVLVNGLGKIEKIYPVKYTNEHDYIYDENKNIVIYVQGLDKLNVLDLKTGKETNLLDLGKLMSSYKDEAVSYYMKNTGEADEQKVDWAHLNSVEIVNETDLILSLRETSSIIYVENVFDVPKIKYIIAPEAIYQGTEYEKYLLKKVGDFPTQCGQHSVNIQFDTELGAEKYYLYFFNNNYAKTTTVPNENWVNTVYGAGTRKSRAANSMYYKYLVDEKEGTYTLVDEIDVTYSNAKSNVQIYNGNYILGAGKKGILDEYNSDKKLLLELFMDIYDDYYRAFKCSMNGFWFDNVNRYTKQDVPINNTSNYTNKEDNKGEFNFNIKTNTILGMNSQNENCSESSIIYYDTIYFTMFDYAKDTLIIPSQINLVEVKKVSGINLANVKKIIVGEGIEKIGDYGFFGCENLEEIVLPSTLKSIGDYAFVKCNNLKSIEIPESVEYIGNFTFSGFDNNQKIILKKADGFSKMWKSGCNAKIIQNKGE